MAAKAKAKGLPASDGFRVADIVRSDSRETPEKYEIRYVEGTPKVYKVWMLIGLLFMSGLILIPALYIGLISISDMPQGQDAGMNIAATLLGSVIMGVISFGVGMSILIVVGAVFWWKHG